MPSRSTFASEPPDIASLAREFGSDINLGRSREIIIALARPGATKKAAELPAFNEGLSRLLSIAREGKGDERLEAMILIARILSQPSRELQSRIRSALLQDFAPLNELPRESADPRDREYLAQIVRISSASNKAEYLAAMMIAEGQVASGARDEAAMGLVESSEDLTQVFDRLSRAFSRAPVDTKDRGTSRARRMQRSLEALKASVRILEPSATSESGPAYAAMLSKELERDQIGDRTAAIQVATEALEFLATFVRSHFSLTTIPQTFEAIKVLRRLFHPARWPDETLPSRLALGRLLQETIALLAAAGVTDNQLRSTLTTMLDVPGAEHALREMSQRQSGLTNEVRHWLATGRALRTLDGGDAAAETVFEQVDSDIARIYREAVALRTTWESLSDDLLDAATDVNATLGRAFSATSTRLKRTFRRAISLGQQRGFELSGEVGDAVEYSPVDHDAEEPLAGTRIVRIVAPMVIRRSRDGSPQLVVKAKVEPA